MVASLGASCFACSAIFIDRWNCASMNAAEAPPSDSRAADTRFGDVTLARSSITHFGKSTAAPTRSPRRSEPTALSPGPRRV